MGGTAAFGTLLKRGDGGGPETFTTVGNVKDIQGPDMSMDLEDVTTHSSAAAGIFKEWLPLLMDGGEVKADVLWDPADVSHQGIQTDQTNRVKRNWQMVFPTTPAKTASFAGYVTKFPFKAPVKGVISRELTIKVTGPVTIT
ncbi:phage tail tube protein [Candidatus Nitrospira bockiana]